MHLIDGCAIGDYIKVYSKNLNKKLESYNPKSIFISAITIEEIEFGFARNLSAKIAGKIRAQLQKKGVSVEQYDILIGATAIANDKILITSNTKHFKRIPYLTTEDWR